MNRDPLKKMKKNKIDAFNNMPNIFKYESTQQVYNMINSRMNKLFICKSISLKN